jgi:excisionase family DNA binding protein
MRPESSAPVLFSVGEVAKRLSISVRSVRAAIAGGKLPTIRPTARRVCVSEPDLAAFIEQHREKAR